MIKLYKNLKNIFDKNKWLKLKVFDIIKYLTKVLLELSKLISLISVFINCIVELNFCLIKHKHSDYGLSTMYFNICLFFKVI